MSDEKTLGQLIDEFVGHKAIECLFLYRDSSQQPHIVLTESEQDYDYTDIFSQDCDLTKNIADKKAEVQALQSKIRQLEKTKKDMIKAIELLRRSND